MRLQRPLVWALPFALLVQLWAMASCCLPSSVTAESVFAPGGTLVICSGAGTRTLDLADETGDPSGKKSSHGDLCGGLCAPALLAVVLLAALLFHPDARLFGIRPPRDVRPRAPPPAYLARGPPLFA